MVTIAVHFRSLLLLLSLLVLGGCSNMLSQSGAGVPVIDANGNNARSAGTREASPAAPIYQPAPYPQPLPPMPSPPSRSTIDQGMPATSPAVAALLNSADKEMQAGRHDRAVAAIERAIRVEPHNALLWSRFALIRFEQGNWQQADVLASRSNSFARNNHALQLQNWRIIAQAKARMGDNAGAAAARQKILQLGEGNF